MSTARYRFEPLGTQNRAAFSCGVEPLDRYLRERAGQEQRRHVASCFVLVDQEASVIIGYYTLSATSIIPTDLPEATVKRLPRYPNLPGILLGRLAVDQRYHSQGFGRLLLVDALRRARDTTSQLGAIAVVVEAKDDAAARFYTAFGFIPFNDASLRLFLPIATIQAI